MAQRSFVSRILNLTLRLLFWYTVATAVFRCPSSPSDLRDDHPQVCQYYSQARSVIEPHVGPYIVPAYDAYVGPYVEAAQPYVKAYSKIYTPAINIGTNIYLRHVEPVLLQACGIVDEQWQKYAQPHVDVVTQKVYAQYQERAQPLVLTATELAWPWLQTAQRTAQRQYYTLLVPTYRKSLPYAQHGYDQARHYAVNHVYPSAKQGVQQAMVFVQRKVWPTLRVLYGQHIEPQLLKIRMRLASYADGRRIETAVSEIDDNDDNSRLEDITSPVSTTIASVLTSLSSSIQPILTDTSSPSVLASTVPEVIEEPTIGAQEETLVTTESASVHHPESSTMTGATGKHLDELRKWELKFTKASEQASKDLQTRISDIISRQIDGQVRGVGQALLTKLEVDAEQALENVKSSVIQAVDTLPAESTGAAKTDAFRHILDALRESGRTIKDRAQQVREWKAQHDIDTVSLIHTAEQSTFHVLDGIRDLGLQKIGMHWADAEDVAYEDWAAYHQLKQKFDELRTGVESVVKEHASVATVHAEAEDVLNSAMATAESAAKELARLKDVAKWKIEAQDASDNFSSHYVPAGAAKLGQKIAGFFSEEAVSSSSEGVVASWASAAAELTASISAVVSRPSESISIISEELLSQIKEGTESVSSVDASIIGTPETLVGQASETIHSAASAFTDPIALTASLQESAGGIVSQAGDLYTSLTHAALPNVAESTQAFSQDDEMTVSSPSTLRGSPIRAEPTSNVELQAEDEGVAGSELPVGVEADLSSSIPNDARSSVTSVAEAASEYGHDARATIAPSISASVQSFTDDVVDAAQASSASLQSMFSEAGEHYTDVTSSLASAAQASASSLSTSVYE